MEHAEILHYFRTQGELSDPGAFAPRLISLPTELPALAEALQGLLVHIFWAEHYGLKLDETRKAEVNLRSMPAKLQRLLELDDQPLSKPRPRDKKLVGNCRDFTLAAVSILRAKGVPARARCGFGTYFERGKFIDHWVAEVWDSGRQRWHLVDFQLDPVMRAALEINFDPFDVPRDRFLSGGVAWQACRMGSVDPDNFGIFDLHGLWFVRGDLIRDALALRKFEVLPWDHWGLMSKTDAEMTSAEMEMLDLLAALTLNPDWDFGDLTELVEEYPGLQVPEGFLHHVPEDEI